jgi:hypothetical protein
MNNDVFSRRVGAFALLAALLWGVFASPAAAQSRDRDRYEGEYGLLARVNGRDSALLYTLYLSRGSGSSGTSGDAELTVEKRGNLTSDDRNGRDYGSIATVYLRDRRRVTHRGTWSVSGDSMYVSLTSIDGRRDNANFTGPVERGGRLLALRVSNTGMYGNAVSFRFERGLRPADEWEGNSGNGSANARDYEGEYRLRERRRVAGRTVELEYRLFLRRGGDAELSVRRLDRLQSDDETGRAFGSMATVYLQNRNEVYHTGRWSVIGNQVSIELTLIDGRRDRAVFSGRLSEGDRRRDDRDDWDDELADRGRDRGDVLDLTVNNRGMYGEVRFRFERR